MRTFLMVLSMLFLITSCDQKEGPSFKIFESLRVADTGVDFENTLTVNDSMSFFTYGYYYMGGGVAVGDVNQDGFQDLYFTGNQVPNKLYLNNGDFAFIDITESAGAQGDEGWITGCAMSDVNADGLMDIYLSVAGIWASRANILLINQGLDAKGVPTFKDEAALRGVADEGFSIQATFLDYDQDGDIDMYVANYEKTFFGTPVATYKKLVSQPPHGSSDHLYENDGTGHFTDVTEEAGLMNFGLSVGVLAADFNNDHLTDLYVSNDFNSPDYFYINNGDGTFTNHLKETVQHTAFYGMGVDIADVNHDGLMDMMQVDMTPADNYRSKANMASMDMEGFWKNVNAGFHYQYMYNTLQVSQGIRENGLPFYADVAKISGMDKTDWSWSPLFADFDLDGFSDLFITNGSRRDVNNKDFFKWLDRLDTKMKIKYKELSAADVTAKLPFQRVDNYIFKNEDGLLFSKANESWGLHYPGFSNGAAYADLDNDGDLEIIVNNIDSTAAIFKNNAVENHIGNSLNVHLQGSKLNPLGLGAIVSLTVGDKRMTKEQTLVRGYQSSVSPVLHFGLGASSVINEIKVTWPDGAVSMQKDISVNQKLTFLHAEAGPREGQTKEKSRILFEQTEKSLQPDFVHKENDYNDFDYQVLLPHRMSRMGPALAVADLNGDGNDEIFVGGAKDQSAVLFSINQNGTYEQIQIFSEDALHEDVDALFFDADGDGDSDLYVVSGGSEMDTSSGFYQDRLYLNEDGKLTKALALPTINVSGGCIVAGDFDGDGDIDLFRGGRQQPKQYPLPVSSLLLDNKTKNGQLTFEISPQPAFVDLGMVTDASWRDIDENGSMDLVVVGEWMPITVFIQTKGLFRNETKKYGLQNTVGWWNALAQGDFDGDGDQDFVVGNLGKNYKYQASEEKTFDIYGKDYDENGNFDIVLGYYEGDKQFPVRGLQCSSDQIPEIKKKFNAKYEGFANATLSDIYSQDQLKESLHYRAQTFASVFLENKGRSFQMKELPAQAQLSSINDFQLLDYNQDGHLDFIAGGNLFYSEIETPRNDACFGWLFRGIGDGSFEYIPYSKSGFYVPTDIKKVATAKTKEGMLVLFASNNAPLSAYQLR